MKRTIRYVALPLLLLFVSSLCLAEDNAEKAPIHVEKKGLGYRYTYQEKPLRRLADFYPIMREHPDAIIQLNKAKTNNVLGGGFGFVGGFFIGWPIGESIAGSSSPTWELAAVGGGLLVVGIVFSANTGRRLREAVQLYNQEAAAFHSGPFDREIAMTVKSFSVGIRF